MKALPLPTSPDGDVTDAVLTVTDLSVEFQTEHGRVRVLDGVDLQVPSGKTLGLVGESGSGKTVTSLAIMGLLDRRVGRISSGSIQFEGQDLAALDARQLRRIQGAKISMIFQEARRSLDPVFTIGDQIAESVRIHEGLSRREAWKRAIEMLQLVQIPDAERRAREYPHTFSGGMCQRVMLASALASRPSLLIADEPTTALDVTVQAQMLRLLRTLQEEMGLAILFITHDLGVVSEMCDRVAVMYAGQIVEEGDATQVFGHPRHPYTEGLIQSLPESAVARGRLAAIPGSVPPAHAWPQGCHFADRCRYAVDACRSGPIPLLSRDGSATRCIRADELSLAGVR
ncbi:ABC transporter ATP-binding protein [Blastococcus sp. URHD0036]|uniref:ABC transporter ATP-binding protein n=1 Tax=Blastococcus sp. URHD0036 TaxID=1380356 RepID=UPI0018CC5126|nr:ABC transporter ATP-binding protein [Blastococcus sp. URHD0036]